MMRNKQFQGMGIVLLIGTMILASETDPNAPVTEEHSLTQNDRDSAFAVLLEDQPEMLLFMDIPEVTSVAGVAKSWMQSPAAITVITNEELRRMGARNFPDALRFVPGLESLRVSSHHYSVGIRSFNDLFNAKLLVLVDGRAIYNPIFGGVFWDIQDLILEDVDRIEVIRGPGATLWGANAFNGVINIITKRADKTQGTYMAGGVGTEDRGFGDLRYGGAFGEKSWYRVWGKYSNRADYEYPFGGTTHDDWDMSRGGWRIDSELPENTWMTFQGDFWHSDRLGEELLVPTGHMSFTPTVKDGRASGGYALFRFDRDLVKENGWSLQAYYERSLRAEFNETEIRRDTIDIDFRHHLPFLAGHDLLWGLNTRMHKHVSDEGWSVAFDPERRTTCKISGFVQDTITLVENEWFTMVGSKFEHNSYTGVEIQPSVRLWWTPDENQVVWAAVSRPVHTPNRLDSDVRLTMALVDPGIMMGGPPMGFLMPFQLQGNDNLDSEKLTAYEVGYRVNIADHLAWDTAGYFYDYEDIITFYRNNPVMFGNLSRAKSLGVESTLDYRPFEDLRLLANYSYNHSSMETDIVDMRPKTAQHMARLGAFWDITDDLELNGMLYYNDKRNRHCAYYPSFVRLDVGITWRPTENLELALWGQNLADEHPGDAYDPFMPDRIEIPKALYFQATLRF
ncbi:MAG: TonB-dependent receptor [Sedimentisphaerales bacterium]|nr:TonB-dependent receptor [Sedimentisphaerales bacterium]